MKALTLYIDKWYIIGAISTDGIVRLITLSNREDRFWLYFYEDVTNNRIVYGKDNQSHYRDKENHYYGDVFSQITDSRNYFKRYGCKHEMSKIFKVAGIFDEFRKAVGTDEIIPTYVSFSVDITGAARLIFLNLLKEENFDIKENVARIEHLALEHGFRHDQFKAEGYYLILNACNENLHYSLYKHADNLFLRETEDKLVGLGTDLRGRALVKTVVEDVNARTHFLSTQEEKEEEYLRMNQYVNNWILKLENAKPHIPITIPNVSFSKQPNSYQVTIIKKKLDEQTADIVNDIVRVIIDFVKSAGIRHDEVKGVVFLGNTFTNGQFDQIIRERFTVNQDNNTWYKESDLPNIIGVYSAMDCCQFSVENKMFASNSETELKRIQNVNEENVRQEQAEREQAEFAERERIAHETEDKYKEAIEQAIDYERKNDYAQMRDWCEIALQHKQDDADAKLKLSDAIRLIAEETAVAKQYNTIIQRAKKSFEAKQWSDALSQSEAAMNVRPASKEAQSIYTEARKRIDIIAKTEKYLTRADLFIAQNAYGEAIDEFRKVLALDETCEIALNRIAEIEHKRKEIELLLRNLTSQLQTAEAEQKHTIAIELCEKLIHADPLNIRKWSEHAQLLKAKVQIAEKEKQKIQQLLKKIDAAAWDEDWFKAADLCKQVLDIQEVEDIRKKLQQIERRLENARNIQQFQQSLDVVKALIVDKQWEYAKKELNNLQSQFPEEEGLIKKMRVQVFKAEDDEALVDIHKKKKEERTRVMGFKSQEKKTKNDFFEKENVKPKTLTRDQPLILKQSVPFVQKDTKKSKSDFFDVEDSTCSKKITDGISSNLNNNDFNF